MYYLDLFKDLVFLSRSCGDLCARRATNSKKFMISCICFAFLAEISSADFLFHPRDTSSRVFEWNAQKFSNRAHSWLGFLMKLCKLASFLLYTSFSVSVQEISSLFHRLKIATREIFEQAKQIIWWTFLSFEVQRSSSSEKCLGIEKKSRDWVCCVKPRTQFKWGGRDIMPSRNFFSLAHFHFHPRASSGGIRYHDSDKYYIDV